LKDGDTTRLEDLALLCANCHRMIHRASPWLSVEELR
jgi:putative restriction endonuclease